MASLMQADYPASFDREQGFTAADWQRCLPGAVRDCPLHWGQAGQATVLLGGGALVLCWQALPPRQIALLRMPRLAVQYRFTNVAAADRLAFMRYFDLYIQRGGG